MYPYFAKKISHARMILVHSAFVNGVALPGVTLAGQINHKFESLATSPNYMVSESASRKVRNHGHRLSVQSSTKDLEPNANTFNILDRGLV